MTMKNIVDTLNEKLDMWEGRTFARGEYPDLDAADDARADASEKANKVFDQLHDMPDGEEKDKLKEEEKRLRKIEFEARDAYRRELDKAEADAGFITFVKRFSLGS
jgi:hypothetical protein